MLRGVASNVAASATIDGDITDNALVRGDGGGNGIQGSTVTLSDTGEFSAITVADANLSIVDNSDATKIAKLECSGITTGTTRTYTLPDANTTLVGTDATQVLTNKTFTDSTTLFQDEADNTKKAQFQLSAIATGTTLTYSFPNVSGTFVLPSNVQTLTNKTYQNPTFTNGIVASAITTLSTDTTLGATHFTVLVDATAANTTITLPAAASNTGRIYNIKKIDASANSVTIEPNGAELIDGAANVSSATQYDGWMIQCDGTAWYILASKN